MAEYYKGEEIKFAINIDAPGFDMDTDDFEIEVASPRNSVKGYKDASKTEDTAVVIFKEESGSASLTHPPFTQGSSASSRKPIFTTPTPTTPYASVLT